MAEAATAVLGAAVRIETDVDIVRYPDRYSDPRGQVMWDRVIDLLDRRLRVDNGIPLISR
jgi:hypothetical protein